MTCLKYLSTSVGRLADLGIPELLCTPRRGYHIVLLNLSDASGDHDTKDADIAPGYMEPSYFVQARRAGRVVVEEPPKFDLDDYISKYKGRTRFDRLLLIGTSSSYLYLEALKVAIAEAKQGSDVGRYEYAVSCLRETAPNDPDATPDVAWIESTKAQVKRNTDTLELELKTYKNNLIKESIRMGYDDLGNHYHRIGDLSKANKAYSQMREFCTTNSHIVIMNMHLINVCIDQKTWFAAQNHIQRIRGATGGQKFPEAEKNTAKLAAAHGLASLASGNYRDAAIDFIGTDPRMSQAKLDDPTDEEAYNEVLTPSDIAIYGGLCALATMERGELQERVLNNTDFRNYLELEPHIRRAITYFVSSKYSPCLQILDSYRADYLLDLYLQPHFQNLYHEIRCKAIRDCLTPFSCITMSALARIFNSDEEAVTLEIQQMIKRRQIKARINSVDRVLYAKQKNGRANVFDTALAAAKEYERTSHLRIMRMQVINAGLEVKGEGGRGLRGGGNSNQEWAGPPPSSYESRGATGSGPQQGGYNGAGDLMDGKSGTRSGGDYK